MAKKLLSKALYLYSNNPNLIKNKNTHFPDAYQLSDGRWKLSAKKKSEIIESCVFCVDIDKQAVENTAMWLYILILEGEGQSLVDQERRYSTPFRIQLDEHFHLPNLDENIIHGNSLVSTNFSVFVKDNRDNIKLNFRGNFIDNSARNNNINDKYMSELVNHSPENSTTNEEGSSKFILEKVHELDWHKTSSKIAKILDSGGFDAISTNPPYIQPKEMLEKFPQQYKYIRKHYKSMSSGSADLSYGFIEKGINMLKKDGYLDYITTNRFLTTLAGQNIRQLINENNLLYKILNFNRQQLFNDVQVHVSMLLLHNAENFNFEYYKLRNPLPLGDLQQKLANNNFDYKIIPSSATENKIWNFDSHGNEKLKCLEKLNTVRLGDLADVRVGINTGNDRVFLIKPEKIDDKYAHIRSKITKKAYKLERNLLKHTVRGRGLRRYEKLNEDYYLIFPYDKNNEVLSQDILAISYPNIAQYLLDHKDSLLKRKTVTSSYYAMNSTIKNKLPDQDRIVWAEFRKSNNFTVVPDHVMPKSSTGVIILNNNSGIGMNALLGILNSSLIREYLYSITPEFLAARAYRLFHVKSIPIVFPNDRNGDLFAQLEGLVRRRLGTSDRIDERQISNDNEFEFDRENSALVQKLEAQIDEVVDKIYGVGPY